MSGSATQCGICGRTFNSKKGKKNPKFVKCTDEVFRCHGGAKDCYNKFQAYDSKLTVRADDWESNLEIDLNISHLCWMDNMEFITCVIFPQLMCTPGEVKAAELSRGGGKCNL